MPLHLGWMFVALISAPLCTSAAASCISQDTRLAKRSPFIEQRISDLDLMDSASGGRFLSKHGPGYVVEEYGFATIHFLSADGTELLEVIQHPGAEQSEFAEFRVRKVLRNEETAAPRIEVTKFLSGRGIALGMEAKEVMEVFGKPKESVTAGGVTRYVYRCADQKVCPELKSANMPIYEGVYQFRCNRLVEMRCGFPYP